MKIILSILFLFISMIPSVCFADVYAVQHVFDGETVIVNNENGYLEVKLLGVDTPPAYDGPVARQEKRRTGKPLWVILRDGRKSKMYLRNLLTGKEVTLEFEKGRDPGQGRKVSAYIHVRGIYWDDERKEIKTVQYYPNQAKMIPSLLLNHHIIRMGLAKPSVESSNLKYAAAFQKAYRQAIEDEVGFWKKNVGRELEDEQWVRDSIEKLLQNKGINKVVMNISMPLDIMEKYSPLVTYKVCFEGRNNCLLVHYDYKRWFLNKDNAF